VQRSIENIQDMEKNKNLELDNFYNKVQKGKE